MHLASSGNWILSELGRTTKRNLNKEASWLYAELKSHISFQVSFVVYLKLSDETWNEMCYLKIFETWVAYL